MRLVDRGHTEHTQTEYCNPRAHASSVNKQQQRLYSNYSSLLLTVYLQLRELEPLVYLSVKFWLQYCYSYTESYTSKSYYLAYSGDLKLIIYHDGIYMWTYKNDYNAVLIILHTHKIDTKKYKNNFKNWRKSRVALKTIKQE